MAEVIVLENGTIIGKMGKPLKPRITNCGYVRVALRIDGVVKDYLIHRLVASTHLENPDNLPTVNHKDGNKLNNHKDNLEWCTKSQNMKHAVATGLHDMRRFVGHSYSVGELNGRAKLTRDAVTEIRTLYPQATGITGEPWKAYGITNVSFFNVIKRKTWRNI